LLKLRHVTSVLAVGDTALDGLVALVDTPDFFVVPPPSENFFMR